MPERFPLGYRLLEGATGIVFGVAFGIVGTLVHQTSVQLGDFSCPCGLVLAFSAVGLILCAFRLLGGWFSALVCGIGVMSVVGVFSLRGIGGSVLIPDNAIGITWIMGCLFFVILTAVWPRSGFLGVPVESQGNPRSIEN